MNIAISPAGRVVTIKIRLNGSPHGFWAWELNARESPENEGALPTGSWERSFFAFKID